MVSFTGLLPSHICRTRTNGGALASKADALARLGAIPINFVVVPRNFNDGVILVGPATAANTTRPSAGASLTFIEPKVSAIRAVKFGIEEVTKG